MLRSISTLNRPSFMINPDRSPTSRAQIASLDPPRRWAGWRAHPAVLRGGSRGQLPRRQNRALRDGPDVVLCQDLAEAAWPICDGAAASRFPQPARPGCLTLADLDALAQTIPGRYVLAHIPPSAQSVPLAGDAHPDELWGLAGATWRSCWPGRPSSRSAGRMRYGREHPCKRDAHSGRSSMRHERKLS